MKDEERCCANCAFFLGAKKPCLKQPVGIGFPESDFCSRFEERCPELPEPPKMKQFKVIINEEK